MEYNFTLQINGIHNKSIDTIFHYNYIQYNKFEKIIFRSNALFLQNLPNLTLIDIDLGNFLMVNTLYIVFISF